MSSKSFFVTLSTLAIGVGLGVSVADSREFTADEQRWCERLLEAGDLDTLNAAAQSESDPYRWVASECLALLAVPAVPIQPDKGLGVSANLAGIPY